MIVSFEVDSELDAEIMKAAEADGHKNRSAVIRKAISFYLLRNPSKPKNLSMCIPKKRRGHK